MKAATFCPESDTNYRAPLKKRLARMMDEVSVSNDCAYPRLGWKRLRRAIEESEKDRICHVGDVKGKKAVFKCSDDEWSELSDDGWWGQMTPGKVAQDSGEKDSREEDEEDEPEEDSEDEGDSEDEEEDEGFESEDN
jgi:hypothetical protein